MKSDLVIDLTEKLKEAKMAAEKLEPGFKEKRERMKESIEEFLEKEFSEERITLSTGETYCPKKLQHIIYDMYMNG